MPQEALIASPVAEQLRRGFRWLRFVPGLETTYRAEQFRGDLKFLRINLGIISLSLLVIFQVEHVVMPAISGVLPGYLRFGVMVPTLLLAFALTFVPRAETWYPRVMAALLPVALMAIAWVGLWAWGLGENRLFVRLIIATIATYFLFGLPFRSALVANLIAVGFYAVAATAVAMPTLEQVNYLCMLFVANMMCAAAGYKMEHTRRTAWLEAQLLDEFAQRDGLTGIYNRRRFDEHLADVWQQGVRERRPVALLFADIDHFKAFNDRYGYVRGDEVLRLLARLLVAATEAERGPDCAGLYHIGGDDFFVVTQPGRADEIAAAVIAQFDAQIGAFYDPDDAARGHIRGVDRLGRRAQFPLMSLSIVAVSWGAGERPRLGELAGILAEVRETVRETTRRQKGSVYLHRASVGKGAERS